MNECCDVLEGGTIGEWSNSMIFFYFGVKIVKKINEICNWFIC